MIINIDEFYNNKNWKQYVPLEAFQEELRLVGETFLKDVKIKNVLSITYSVDDYGENPVYIEYIDENEQKHLVKLKPAIHEELVNMLKDYAKITYVDSEIAKAIQASKDYTDETKEALTILINGSKEEAINISKAYTDIEINKLNTDLREYIHEREVYLFNEIVTYSNSAVEQAYNQSKEYTDREINKAKQEVKDYADAQDNAKLLESKEYADAKYNQALNAIEAGDTNTLNSAKEYAESQNKVYDWDTVNETWNRCNGSLAVHHNGTKIKAIIYEREPGGAQQTVDFNDFASASDVTALTNKLSNVWGGHKAPFIYWISNIDVNTMKLENTENDVKTTINDSDIVYWPKNPSMTQAQVEAIVQEQISELKANNEKLKKIIQNLTNSGAWDANANDFYPDRNIATGNINFFAGQPDNASFIRTNNGQTENDVTAGI